MTIPLREARGEEVTEQEMAEGGPQHVAPVVAWLCTEEAAGISGEIVHCGRGLVGIMQQPAVIRSFEKRGSERWTIDELDNFMPQLLEARRDNVEAAQDSGAPDTVG